MQKDYHRYTRVAKLQVMALCFRIQRIINYSSYSMSYAYSQVYCDVLQTKSIMLANVFHKSNGYNNTNIRLSQIDSFI